MYRDINGVNGILDDAHVSLFIFASYEKWQRSEKHLAIYLRVEKENGKNIALSHTHSSTQSGLWLNIEYFNYVLTRICFRLRQNWCMKRVGNSTEKGDAFVAKSNRRIILFGNRSWPEIENENWLCKRIFDWNGRAIMALKHFFPC